MASQIDLFRYHDLTERLAVFSTAGGAHVRGDTEDLRIEDAEPALQDGENERARIIGMVELFGARSIPGRESGASFGLVAKGPATLIVTSERLITMFVSGSSQLGQIDASAVHTFVFPWDLVDSIAMAKKKSFADRVAGTRTVDVASALMGFVLRVWPKLREVGPSQSGKLRDDECMQLLVSAAAEHRLTVSPEEELDRVQATLNGLYDTSGEELTAWITDPEGPRPAVHLVGRLVEH